MISELLYDCNVHLNQLGLLSFYLIYFQVWLQAAIQVFYSLGPTYGGAITMASHNKFHQKSLLYVQNINEFICRHRIDFKTDTFANKYFLQSGDL